MIEDHVSVLDPRFPSLYIFNIHALSLHTQGEVCRLENSATSSTTPQGRPAWIAFPQLLGNIFLVVCANVSILMLVSLCKHLKRGETGLRATCLPNILEQELQRNPFDGFFYPLNDLSIGVLIGSTQVRFRVTLPQNIQGVPKVRSSNFMHYNF